MSISDNLFGIPDDFLQMIQMYVKTTSFCAETLHLLKKYLNLYLESESTQLLHVNYGFYEINIRNVAKFKSSNVYG